MLSTSLLSHLISSHHLIHFTHWGGGGMAVVLALLLGTCCAIYSCVVGWEACHFVPRHHRRRRKAEAGGGPHVS